MKKLLSLLLLCSLSFADTILLEKKDIDDKVFKTEVLSTIYTFCKDGIEYSYIEFKHSNQIFEMNDKNLQKKCNIETNK